MAISQPDQLAQGINLQFVTPEFIKDIGKRLDHCWICKTRLADAGGNPLFLRNEHHVIPRAFGGEDGPLCTLDTAHHDQMHIIANNLMSGKDCSDLLSRFKPAERQRVLYLASRVILAARAVEGDPNKRIATHFSLSRAENEAFRKLCDFHGVSKDALIKKLLGKEYSRCFPTR